MNLKQMIEKLRADLAPKLTERAELRTKKDAIRGACVTDGRAPSEDEARQVVEHDARIVEIDAEVERINGQITEYQADLDRDEALDKLQREVHPTGVTLPGGPEERLQVTTKRTYNADADRSGKGFLSDVAASMVRGNRSASDRLDRHMAEEIAERGEQLDRATSTANYEGLVIPQYLVDLYAPKARAGRPFADACRHHDLPETGMVAYLSKVTTGTSTALQSAQGDTVSETDFDDTTLTIPVLTNAGSQSISRQGLERGIGVEASTMEDLFRAHDATLDNTLLNQATRGLTNVATSIAYTDASPTGAELYPKLLQAPAAVEAALLDMAQGDTFAVMHSRRWYWLQSQLSASWPTFATQGIPTQSQGVNYGESYGSGFRGLLPSGVPVIVDNNVATNLGTGTNEDEIYFPAQSECHLWEDPSAPMMIKAEQNQAKKLLVDFVVYSYFAYEFTRRAHAQKITGTGLVTPAFA